LKIKRIEALQCTTLFGGLATKELADVAQRAIELHLQKSEMLFLAGESAKGLYVIIDGKIRAFQQNEDGREQVMDVHSAGSVLGDVPVFDDGPFTSSAISEADTHVLLIEKNDIRELCAKYPSLALAALKLMAAKVRRHASLIEALSLHEVGQRLALFLLAEARSATLNPDVPKPFCLRLSNQEIASRIGSVRDVVSRALTRLKHEGLISLDNRTVTILNMQALKRYAARGSTLSARTVSDFPKGIESLVLSDDSTSGSGLH
jgi:CRP/FNR family transcriptional regulator